MKKHLRTILVSLAAFLLVGCTEEYVTEERTMPKADSPKVEKAINELNQFLQTMEIQTTRNGNAFTVDDVQYVTRNMSTTRSADNIVNDTILYLVNFGTPDEDGGYAILNAKENTDMRVLAVVEKGSIAAEDFIFEDKTIDIPNFNFYNTEEDDFYVGTTEAGAEADQFVHFAAVIDPSRYPGSYGCDVSPWATIATVEPMLTTLWNQSAPFNNESPIVNGEKTLAGCVAIALGQILAYHEYPSFLTIDGLECKWTDMKSIRSKTNSINLGTEEQQSQVARFIRAIGKECNMIYYSDEAGVDQWSFALPSGAENCMESDYFKYKNVKRVLRYDEDAIIEAIDNGCPAFVAGISGRIDGHAWVIDGYKRQFRTVNNEIQYRYYVHCDWGWKGDCNGYYHSGIFDLIDGDNEFDRPYNYNNIYNYHKLFRTITYDNPNK